MARSSIDGKYTEVGSGNYQITMPVMGNNEGKIVLAHSRKIRLLQAFGEGLIALLVVLFIWVLISGLGDGKISNVILGLLGILFLLSLLVTILSWYCRRIVLLKNYISFYTWHGVPHVYTYDEIADIETVHRSATSEWGYVKLTFYNGKSIRVPYDLITPRSFRKLLREKTGRTFRKNRKRKS